MNGDHDPYSCAAGRAGRYNISIFLLSIYKSVGINKGGGPVAGSEELVGAVVPLVQYLL